MRSAARLLTFLVGLVGCAEGGPPVGSSHAVAVSSPSRLLPYQPASSLQTGIFVNGAGGDWVVLGQSLSLTGDASTTKLLHRDGALWNEVLRSNSRSFVSSA
jgi:hypothetical protein